VSAGSVIRSLLATLRTAEAITAYLAEIVTVTNSEPMTYNVLLRTGLVTPDELKAFDQELAADGFDWIRAALAGAGVDISDPLVQKVFTLLPNGVGEKIAAVGTSTIEQWRQLGLDQAPTLDDVQRAIDVVPDGRAISVSLRLTLPDGGASVALMVQQLAGTDPLDIVEAFSSASPDDERLTKAQRQFYADLVALVATYGGTP